MTQPVLLGSSGPGPELPLFFSYLERLAAVEERGDAREESFYPALAELLGGWAARRGRREVHVTTIPRRVHGCNPDFQVWEGRHRLVGYVEAKRPGTRLGDVERGEQGRRYLETFPNLILTDFLELRLYRDGREAARTSLSPSWPPRPGVGRREAARREEELAELLELFFGFEIPRRPSAAALAQALARRARVLEGRIEDLLERDREREEPSELTVFYRALSSGLFAQLDERRFADLYAQTLACGLLAARFWDGGELDRRTLHESIPAANGILRDIFRYVSLSPPPELEWIVDDLVDLLRPASVRGILERSFRQRRERDPVLHFYETFLQHYDAGLRARHGVYYTPPAVVSFVVRSLDHLLRGRLGLVDGLADSRVRLLDPAAGTMTFVAEACRRAIDTWRYGRGSVLALIRDHLLPHFFGFELMMAPYTVGHLNMDLFLAEQGYRPGEGERVHLLLTNALEEEEREQPSLPLMPSLAREVRKAAEVKRGNGFCVILGNPPWFGRSANPSRTESDPLRHGHIPGDEGYYRVDGEPLKERNTKWLQDDYVKFLRFAQRQIDAHGEGVLGLVLNHSFLDNATFAGLRRSLMNSFQEIYVLDLHGNRRKRETAPDGGTDENVFDQIAQGVCILLAVKKPGLPRRVARFDLWGTRAFKLRWLATRDAGTAPWCDLEPPRSSYLYLVRDARLEESYARGLPLPEIFPEHSPGVLTARDAFAMAFDRAALEERIARFRAGQGETLPRDTGSWKLAEAMRRARVDGAWRTRLAEVLVRPFDVRHLFYADYLIERPRARVMRHLLAGSNTALVVPRQSKDGPGALVTDRVAAHKAVSAYEINHVFPLYLLEEAGMFGAGSRVPNLSPDLLERLHRELGEPVTPEAVLGYVYAVLYAPAYRRRFAGLLAAGFPRIPFPRERRLFKLLAGLGAELVDLHLLRQPRPVELADVGFPAVGSGAVAGWNRRRRDYRESERRVYVNDEGQLFDRIPPRVWHYRVGGYQVLDHWLRERAGRVLSLAEIQSFIHVAAALRRTLEVEEQIERAYAQLAP